MSQVLSNARAITTCRMILATDLDGTFLGGSEAERQRLYDWIETHRDSVGLMFVTGRDLQFVGDLCQSGVPWPEYVIGDVGTTIAQVDGTKIRPIADLERQIAHTWNEAGDTVKAVLDQHPGLTLQPTNFRYRVSYDLNMDEFDPSAHAKVQALGHDSLVSNHQFFDVLPHGVAKGPSLIRLLKHLGIVSNKLLVAGDTLNDLSLLQCGLQAVAVGGSEPDLLQQVQSLDHVYVAKGVGAAGITEAIAHFKLHDELP